MRAILNAMTLAKQGLGWFLLSIACAVSMVFPFAASADSDGTPPSAPSITINGVPLPPVSPFANSLVATSSSVWSGVLTFEEDISNIPSLTDGTPSFGFGNGTVQTVDDCADEDLKTFCFTYMPPLGVEAAVFWFFKVSGAEDLSGEAMADATYRFVLDTGGPILSFTSIIDNVSLPTISGDSSFASALIDITLEGPATRHYQTSASGGMWSFTLPEGDELPEGLYTVTVFGTDQYHNHGETIMATLTAPVPPPPVDTEPPFLSEVTPIGTTGSQTPSYSFNSSEAGTIAYSGACQSGTANAALGINTIVFSTLPYGSYIDCLITVIDAAGNASQPLMVSPFTILPTLSLQITGGPAEGSVTNSQGAVFTFDSNAPTFCSVDNSPLVECPGSYHVSGLMNGPHSFTVSATDAGNNTLSRTRQWTVDTVAPVLHEVSPIGTTQDTTPAYTFSSTEAGSIVYGGACGSPSSSATAGSNTVSFSTLAPGTYSNCTVRVLDAAGNTSVPLAVSPFTIAAPVGSLLLTVTATGGDATFTFSGDLGAFTVSTTGGLGQKEFTDLAPGTYHLTAATPSGWSVGSNTCAAITVVSGEEATCAVSYAKNTVTSKKGHILGLLFNDKDGDGKLDHKGEVTLLGSIGWKVYLDTNNNGLRDSSEPTTTTTLFGLYFFKDLSPGTYKVRVEPKAGKVLTKPSAGYYSATVAAKHTTFAGLFGWK